VPRCQVSRFPSLQAGATISRVRRPASSHYTTTLLAMSGLAISVAPPKAGSTDDDAIELSSSFSFSSQLIFLYSCFMSRFNIFFSWFFSHVRLSSIFPFSTVFRRQSRLGTCPIHFVCRCLMTKTKKRCFCTRLKTSLFDTCAV